VIFKRGNDGLTDAERAAYAESWRTRAGEHERVDMVVLTPQEFAHLRSLLPEHWRPYASALARRVPPASYRPRPTARLSSWLRYLGFDNSAALRAYRLSRAWSRRG
jgi:hypothetical protein